MSTSGKQYSPLLKPFYPAFDGFRAVAFLMVFLVHYGTMVWSNAALGWGWAGVDIFFVLSGFLITGILYESLQSERFLRNFYLRRAVRILPLLVGLWIALLALTPILHIMWNRYNLAMAGFLGNNLMASGKLGLHPRPSDVLYLSLHHAGSERAIGLAPLWSLCMEEQFYLVWPLMVLLVRSRRALLTLCLVWIVAAPVLRGVYLHLHPAMWKAGELYYSTWSRADTMLVGAGLALWLRGRAPKVGTLRRAARWTVVLAPACLAAVVLLFPRPNVATELLPVVSIVGYSLIAFAAAGMLIMAMDETTWLSRGLQWPPLRWLGRRSYGLYILHGIPAGYFFAKAPWMVARHLGFLVPCLAFALTLAAATLSFRYLESPWLRLKRLWAPEAGRVEDPKPEGVASVTLPRLSTGRPKAA